MMKVSPNVKLKNLLSKYIYSHWKKISMVDMRGQNRSIVDLRQSKFDDAEQWHTGLSQTSGMRNK